ncbi:ABC transporter [Streptomyces sp. NPDC029526]|uniref:ABC transporter n=1 Tax=Streptomyces sp. NPDC029526 TaxID=3155728 RepID=UPI003408D46A
MLVRPVARTLPWWALGAGSAVGLLLAAVPRMTQDPSPWSTVNALRASAVAFAAGLAFLLDDPARHTTAAVPTRRAVRHTLRLVLVAPVAALWWTAALLLVPPSVRPPAGDMTLEAATAVALALAGAACAVHRSDSTRPGQAVAGALLASTVVAPLLWPERWPLFVVPGDDRWAAAHDRWAVLLCVAVLLWAVCSTEPLRRRALRGS